jgi:hypothetical protein
MLSENSDHKKRTSYLIALVSIFNVNLTSIQDHFMGYLVLLTKHGARHLINEIGHLIEHVDDGMVVCI